MPSILSRARVGLGIKDWFEGNHIVGSRITMSFRILSCEVANNFAG